MAAGRLTTGRDWPVRAITFADRDAVVDPTREWIVTNGLGGFASGVVTGGLTRRYHGLLVAAHPAPLGRIVHVAALRMSVRTGVRDVWLDHEDIHVLAAQDEFPLASFRLEAGLPVWRYELAAGVIERRVFMPRGANTTVIQIRRLEGDVPVSLACEVVVSGRTLHAAVDETCVPVAVSRAADGVELRHGDAPALRLRATSPVAWTLTPDRTVELDFPTEHARGYAARGCLDVPCRLEWTLEGQPVAIEMTTDEWTDPVWVDGESARTAELDRRSALLDAAAVHEEEWTAELVLAADQFIIAPVGHAAEFASRRPATDRRSVIAGYHWFTDWGRDTMISLDGLTLATGRYDDAAQILRLFGGHVHEGLIPNLFPEGQRLGLYHTADATLWLFEAIARYVRVTGDRRLLEDMLPTLADILEWHRRGTRFGIGVDPRDGLLEQGAVGYALTWMDARMDDWVVTPRRGKAVEINALWFNAVALASEWFEEATFYDAAALARESAHRARAAFNDRFWNPDTGWLFDVVDGDEPDDPRCRPNQLLAISLSHAVLDPGHWGAVLRAVERHLLTPLGLRTLAPDARGYQSQYTGDLRSRDGAYHQGTVWPWLIGPYVDAVLKEGPAGLDAAGAALDAFHAHLSQAGIGSISEICDADSPHVPRGCIAQAWSVAEVLRVARLVSAWRSRVGRDHGRLAADRERQAAHL